MVIYEGNSYEEISERAAQIIASELLVKPNAVLGLATGSSPVGMYENLVRWNREGTVDFSGVTTVNLDEYKGLGPEDDQGYRYFMNTHLFDHVNIKKENTYVPDGLELDSDKACAAYESLLERVGKRDIQVLGLGGNGHIGFNEPDTKFCKGTHCVRLAESTIAANARFFDKPEDVPTEAYSMGVKGILEARKILMVVSGEQKAKALCDIAYGPITPEVPGSILQLHEQVIVLADPEAMAVIKGAGYVGSK